MITSERCSMCETKHHNGYICSRCYGSLGSTNPHNIDWKFCPFCGEKLYPEGLNREQRIEFTDALYRGDFPVSETKEIIC